MSLFVAWLSSPAGEMRRQSSALMCLEAVKVIISFPHAQVLLVATTFVCMSEAKPGGGSQPVGECMPSCRKLVLCVTSRTVPWSVSISAHRLCFLASALGVMLSNSTLVVDL